MDVDQRTSRLKSFLFFCFISAFCIGQQSPPFLENDTSKKKEYEFLRQEILMTKGSALEKIEQRIHLASVYKEQKDVLTALEEKRVLDGETAGLYYLIAGTNGIIALQLSRFFSIPYVRAMLENFDKSIALDPTFTPSYEAYVEALCMVPALLGGDVNKAKRLATALVKLSPFEGYFAQGYIAESQALKDLAVVKYTQAFNSLLEVDFCTVDLEVFFSTKSMNLPYKIAELSVQYDLASAIGLCSIDYFIDHQSALYNLPLEWAYFRKAQLHKKIDQTEKAYQSISQALEINPNFTLAKQFKQTHWSKI